MKLRPEVYSRVLAKGINLREKFELKGSGIYSLRVVVIENNTGQMGTAGEWVKAH